MAVPECNDVPTKSQTSIQLEFRDLDLDNRCRITLEGRLRFRIDVESGRD